MIEQHPDLDAGLLTPAEQDRAIDGCFQCGRCLGECPYGPEVHELHVDVPRLMLRAVAMQHATGSRSLRSRLGTRLLTDTGVAGRMTRASVGTIRRRLTGLVSDVSPVRRLAPLRRPRFSSWFRRRSAQPAQPRRGNVTIMPTCLVEHHAPHVGRALVHVAERNGLDCSLSAVRCCGAPWLHAGDVERFTKMATANVATLAAEIRQGGDVVVPQARCAEVLVHDYLTYVGGPEAEFVAGHAHDAIAYLHRMHDDPDRGLDTRFDGDAPERIVYHPSDGRRRPVDGVTGADLLTLAGAAVTVVDQSAGLGVTWGERVSHDPMVAATADRLVERLRSTPAHTVVGEDLRDHVVIEERSGIAPRHPLEILARAYGGTDDDPAG
jgi:Fe-S oxidoreductase